MASDLDKFTEGVKFARDILHKAVLAESEMALSAKSEAKRGLAKFAAEKLADAETTLDLLLEHTVAASDTKDEGWTP